MSSRCLLTVNISIELCLMLARQRNHATSPQTSRVSHIKDSGC